MPIGLAALAAASCWASLGTMAIVQADTRIRIVALPPWWLLVLLVGAAVAGAWRTHLRIDGAWPLALSAVLWLPFWPGHIPPAWLIWQGPIEALVWCTVAVGLVRCQAWPRLSVTTRWWSDPQRAPWLATGLAAGIYAAGAVAVAERLPAGDEPHYLVQAASLLRDGDLQIGNNHDRLDYVGFAPNELPPHYVARGQNGQIYSVHAPGLAVLVLPAFALGGYEGASAMAGVASAAAAGLGWRTAWVLTASTGAAWFATFAVFLTAPFLLHAFTVFPDGPGSLGVVAGLWLLVSLETGARVRIRGLLLTGLALGCLPWLHTRFAVLAGTLGLAILARLLSGPHPQRLTRTLAFMSGPVVLGIAWFSFFRVVWGTFNPAAPYGTSAGMRLRNVWPSLQGLFLDQQYGLWLAAPVYLMVMAGMVALAERRRLALETLVAVAAYVLAVAGYEMWWGGFGGPARFLVAALPIAVLPLAWLWSRGGGLWRSALLLALVTSLLIMVARLTVAQGAFAYATTFGEDPVLDWAASSVHLPAAVPSLLRSAEAWRIAAGWLLSGATAWAVAWMVWRRWPMGPGTEWALVSLVAAAVVMTMSTATWDRRHAQPLAPVESQMAFLDDWQPERQPLTLQWRRPYWVPANQLLRRVSVLVAPSAVAGGRASAFVVPTASAADYEIVLDGQRPFRGELVARAGEHGLPIDRWPLNDAGNGPMTLRFRLPVAVNRLTMTGDRDALATVRELDWRVASLGSERQRQLPEARRAVRFGRLRVFFLDDRSFAEPGGFWTLGESTTGVLLDPDPGTEGVMSVHLQSGPVATSVTLAVGGWQRHVTLGPQSRQTVELPAEFAGHDQVLTLRTGPMFLPVQHDPKHRDFRHLGVWVEVS